MNSTDILNKLIEKENLSTQEAKRFLSDVMKGEVTPIQIAAILTALRMKGEEPGEIVGFIMAMRQMMQRIDVKNAIDVCGTGGDGANTFNVSTAVSFVVAGTGVMVAKHGNRAASSSCGAADVLEALGVTIVLTPHHARDILEKINIVFLFAPLYHPATKHVIEVRKALKIPTIFNFLGPFLNPTSCRKQLIGAPNVEIGAKLATVGKLLKYEHLLIVTGEDGLDEASISANSIAFDVAQGQIKKFIINPETYGMKKVARREVLGGTAVENAHMIRTVLKGSKGPRRDIVILNSACALYAAGATKDIRSGISVAADSIDSGRAETALERLIGETKKYA